MASLNPVQGTLGRRRAAHLLRRASFRYTRAKVEEMSVQGVSAAVSGLLQLTPQQLTQPVYDSAGTTWILPVGQALPDTEFNLQRRVAAWWLNEALHDPGVGHKMSFFFHQFLVTTLTTLSSSVYYDYLALLRWGALGNFKDLARKIIHDNSMVRYLNNDTNTKSNPQENFAREFLELFTIGKGPQIAPGDYTHYTEDDIVQAAKVLTGYQLQTNRLLNDTETGLPRAKVTFSRHHTGNKQFSAKFQDTIIAGATSSAQFESEITGFVNMVFAQEQVSLNFCRRIYRYFVHRNISEEVENDIIVPLAQTFRNNGYEILPVLTQLFKSQHFYDMDDSDNSDEIVGGMIKSPLELSLQALSFFNIAIPNPLTQNTTHYNTFWISGVMDRMLALANLNMFAPPDVAGYPAYHQEPDYSRHWFNSTSIVARYKLPTILLTGKRVIGSSPNSSIGIKLNITPWIKTSGVVSDPADAYVLVRDLMDYMLPANPSTERFDYFYNEVFLDGLPAEDWAYEWANYLSTGNETEVRIPLERLITGIMYSPEYQTY